MDAELQELYDHAKAVVNRERKRAGLRALGKLKRGFANSMGMCTIAESLRDAGVCAASYQRASNRVFLRESLRGSDAGRWITIDDPGLSRFMAAFDAGLYPDLIVKRKSDIKINKEVVIPKG